MYRIIVTVFMANLLLITGCVKLKEEPKGNLSPANFYKTSSDFDAAIVGTYKPLFGAYEGFDFDFPFIAECGAEDVHTIVRRWRGIENLTATASQFDEITIPIWRGAYASINNANAIVSNLGNAQGIPAAKLDEYEGQAKFLRAFSYFNLVRWFGEVPIITAENQSKADEVAQSPVQDIYNLIVSDLKDAENKLPVSLAEKGKAVKGSAKALLAKVYLTMAGWPLNQADKYALAKAKAKEVMDMNVYKLENNFADLWKVANKLTNKEFIFTLHGISTAGWIPGSHLHLSTRQWDGGEAGWGDFETDKRFLNIFPAGPRKDATFYTVARDGTPWQNSDYGQPYIAKYRDAGGPCGPNDVCAGADGDGFAVMLRYADVLLIYAEAANQADGNPSAQALEAINKVRRRANGHNPDVPNVADDLPAGMTKAAFDKAVLDERNWELAFEHNRWFDLIRRDILQQTMGAAAWYPGAQYRKLLPKPTTEVTLIKNNGLKQNEGY